MRTANILPSVSDTSSPTFQHLPQPPTTDYIRPIKVLSIDRADLTHFSELGFLFPAGGLYYNARDALTCAVFSHQLDQIQSLTIAGERMERYIDQAHQMCKIKYIQFICNDSDKIAEAYHGQDQLRDCRATENPLMSTQIRAAAPGEELGTEEVVEELSGNDFALGIVDAALKLYRLLPPFNTRCSPDEEIVRPVGQLLDADMDRLTHLKVRPPRSSSTGQTINHFNTEEFLSEVSSPNPWRLLQKLFPERSAAEILQQCRFLETLDARIDANVGAQLFQWAEKRRRRRRRLVLEKTHDGELQPVEDAIRAFSTTLEHLTVTGVPPTRPATSIPPSSQQDQQSLYLYDSVPFLNLAVASFPRLAELSMHIQDAVDVDAYLLERSVDDVRRETLWRETLWPELTLPSIETLDLVGRSAVLFHPASLSKIPGLRALLAQRWVWKWSLSYLTTLRLGGLRDNNHFSFKILRFCPRLQSLVLSTEALANETENQWSRAAFLEDEANEQDDAAVGSHQNGDFYNSSFNDLNLNNNRSATSEFYRLRVKSVLDNQARDQFPQLQHFELQGHWHLSDQDELSHLLHTVLPGLESLAIQHLDSLTVDEWVAITRRHPSLRLVHVTARQPRVLARRMAMTMRPTTRWAATRGSPQGKTYTFGGAWFELQDWRDKDRNLVYGGIFS
ncbi:hypothetical protein BGZ73_009232 [Actinomortierella ambigua]|nr:hypothetical protein BGZ73_009232 [Actinomortierella ambigua]